MTRKNFNLTAVKPYNGVNLNIFTADGDENLYIARKQVGDALGYSHGSEAVSQLHRDHAELLDKSSALVLIKADFETRRWNILYNQDGILEICRLSRKPQARKFANFVNQTVKEIKMMKFENYNSNRNNSVETGIQDAAKSNDLAIYTHPEFGRIRGVVINGEPWFVGKDVAAALGYSAARNAIAAHVDSEDKLTHRISASGQMRDVTVINESGVYALIFGSKLDNAKRFKHWVTHEVLPSIRKTGGYAHNSALLNTSKLYNDLEDIRGRIAELSVSLEAVKDALNRGFAFERERLAKISRTVSYINYFETLNFRSGYNKKWKDIWWKRVLQISGFLGKDAKSVLRAIYKEMENRCGVTLNDFSEDYKRVKNISYASGLEVISNSVSLRQKFENIVTETMEICGLSDDNDGESGDSLLFSMISDALSEREAAAPRSDIKI